MRSKLVLLLLSVVHIVVVITLKVFIWFIRLILHLTPFPCLKIAMFCCNSPSLCVSKGIGGTSSSQSVSAEPRLADRDGAGSRTCGLMPTGEVLDSRDSVEDRPLSAAKLSTESEMYIWRRNSFYFPRTKKKLASHYHVNFKHPVNMQINCVVLRWLSMWLFFLIYLCLKAVMYTLLLPCKGVGVKQQGRINSWRTGRYM